LTVDLRPVSAAATTSPADLGAAIARLVGAPPPLLLVLDYDGTLAAVTRDSEATVIDPLARRSLRRLAALGDTLPPRLVVTVLTGRTVRDVASRVRVGGVRYLGDHGLQVGALPRHGRPASIRVRGESGFEAQQDPAERLARGVAERLGRPAWLYVEHKGPSVAFHVRKADDVASARSAVLAAVAAVEEHEGLADHGLAHYRGRSVVDLRPVLAGGKREAVERLVERERPGAILVMGDELSDVDAFAATRDVAARDRRLVARTVAVHGSGHPAPAELTALADLQLGSAHDVARFLAALARRLDEANGRG